MSSLRALLHFLLFRGAKFISHAASPLVKKNAWRDGNGGGGEEEIIFCRLFVCGEAQTL